MSVEFLGFTTEAVGSLAVRCRCSVELHSPDAISVCCRTQKPLRHPKVALRERRPRRRRGDKKDLHFPWSSWKTSWATMWGHALVWTSRGKQRRGLERASRLLSSSAVAPSDEGEITSQTQEWQAQVDEHGRPGPPEDVLSL